MSIELFQSIRLQKTKEVNRDATLLHEDAEHKKMLVFFKTLREYERIMKKQADKVMEPRYISKEDYVNFRGSGMMFVIYPECTGNYEKDKLIIKKF